METGHPVAALQGRPADECPHAESVDSPGDRVATADRIRYGELMSSFSARLQMTGQSRILLGVLVDVTDESVTATFANNEVARWSLDQVEIRHLPDGFHISRAGEEAVLGVTEPGRFASALRIVDARMESRDAPRARLGRREGQSTLRRPSLVTVGGAGR